MPGDRIPHSDLPTAEMGTALLLNVMQLNFNQADFLMHYIDLFCVDFGAGTPASFTDIEGKEVILDHKQIEDLYLKIQKFKFVDN